MSSDKNPQGEGIFGGIISLFWNKKAAPAANANANTTTADANKGQDYIAWSDNIIKKCSELVVALEDTSVPSSRLLSLMNELEPLFLIDHETSSLRAPNDSKVSATLLALGFALLDILNTSKIQQAMTGALKLLAKLLARAEFDILQPMSQSGLYRWTPDQQKKARQYRSLLVKTHIMIANQLSETPIAEPNSSIISVSLHLTLYPRILAILYWRLPYVGVLLRKAIGMQLTPESKLNDFSGRPEFPHSPVADAAPNTATTVPKTVTTVPKTATAAPKRGRVKADSKAPPPMANATNASIPSSSSSSSVRFSSTGALPSATSSTGSHGISSSSSNNSTNTGGAKLVMTRPHSSSERSATPPAFIAPIPIVPSSLPQITVSSAITLNDTVHTDSPIQTQDILAADPNSGATSSEGSIEGGNSTIGNDHPTLNIISPDPLSPDQLSPDPLSLLGEKFGVLLNDGLSMTLPTLSPPLTPPISTNTPTNEGTANERTSPYPNEPNNLTTLIDSDDAGKAVSGTSSPPVSSPSASPPLPPHASSPSTSTSPSPPHSSQASLLSSASGSAATVPGITKSNPKMPRRTGANQIGFNTVPANAKCPNFSFKVSLTPTSIELNDDLMEWMVLPKIGEVPFYPAFDPESTASARPHTIPWASWMRVCKRLGIISNEGVFTPTTTDARQASKKPKDSKYGPISKVPNSASIPGPSYGSQSSSTLYAPANIGSAGTTVTNANNTINSNVDRKGETARMVGARSLLYNWVNFHQTLVDMGPETYLSPGCIQSPAYFVEQEPRIQWLTWFERGQSLLFVLFIKEWVHHTTLMLSRTNELYGVDWDTIPGYKQMELALMAIFHPMVASRLSMPLLDTSRPLIRCNPEMLGWFVKYCFNQTNAHSTESVNAMFSKLEMWFAELDRNLLRVPASFDVDYFLAGFDIIIQIDHHVILSRLLAFVFTYAHTLRGRVRRAIIEDFFIKKHFFTLFLHWDDMVRNYYQQFLIYKTVRIRKLPHIRHGLIPPTPEALEELLSLATTNHQMPVNRRSMYGAITTQTSSSSTSVNVSNPHGLPMQPLPSNSFNAGVDAEGFLVDPTDDEYLQDMRLFTIAESLVRIVEDQIVPSTTGPREPAGPESQTTYAKSLEIYAPRALSEYNFYLSRYEQKYMCAKLLPMSILQEKRTIIPKSNRPKNSD